MDILIEGNIQGIGNVLTIIPENIAFTKITKSSLRLIVNETAGKVLYRHMAHDNITNISYDNKTGKATLTFASSVPAMSASDVFSIKLYVQKEDIIPTDYAKPSHITAGVNEIKNFLGVAGSDGGGQFQALSMQEIFNMCDDIDTAILGENHPGLVTAEDHAAIIAAINIEGDIEWNDYVNPLNK